LLFAKFALCSSGGKKKLLRHFSSTLDHIFQKDWLLFAEQSARFAAHASLSSAIAAARSNYNAIVTLPSQRQLLILSCFRNGNG
jgi:hypothetical protein